MAALSSLVLSLCHKAYIMALRVACLFIFLGPNHFALISVGKSILRCAREANMFTAGGEKKVLIVMSVIRHYIVSALLSFSRSLSPSLCLSI